MNVQVIVTPTGEELIVLTRREYERMRKAAGIKPTEKDADQRATVEAKAILARIRAGEESVVPLAVSRRLLAGENPVRVWREARGMSIGALAEAANITSAYLSQIETGKRSGTIATLKVLATALAVDLDLLA
jgi:ribosome-binding protein aMBF1 (putative translation factor)